MSRFIKKKSEIKYDILAIISGPEPQRSILEKTLINELKILKKKSLLLQGKPEKKADIHQGRSEEGINIKEGSIAVASFFVPQTISSRTTFPATSVSLKSRPA